MLYIKRTCLFALCLVLLSACDGGAEKKSSSETDIISQQKIGALTLKAWVGEANTHVETITSVDGLEFYRTTDADCDLANYATCTNGQMDILNGTDLTDTAFLLDQSAYYTLKVDNDQVSLPVSARHFQPRAHHEVVAFKGKLWVFGGLNNNGRNMDIWSSVDGQNWVLENPYGSFERRQDQKVVEYKGKLWMFGGALGTAFSSTIYSSKDGVNWDYEGFNSIVARVGQEVIVYQDKLWMIGGHSRWVWRGSPDLNFYNNDVWTSEDGVTWNRVEVSQPFPARSRFGLAVFNDKMWIVGGLTKMSKAEGEDPVITELADVWSSSDGANWTQSPATGFEGRMEHQLTVFDGKLWMTGGRTFESNSSVNAPLYFSDDGETWTQDGGSNATKTYSHEMVAWNDELWIIGGYATVDLNDEIVEFRDDVWHSKNGSDWVQDSSTNVIEPLNEHQMVEFNEKLWLIGEGSDSGDRASGVWYSEDGMEWTAAESDTDFSELHGHQVVSFNDKLWVIAGEDSEYRNTVWSSSDGIAWTMENADPGFPARKDHQVTVFNGALWMTGGQKDLSSFDDIWTSTDGATWSEIVTDTHIGGRYLHQMFADGDKLRVMGGASDDGLWDDAWFSEDGTDWTKVGGRWSQFRRKGHQMVVFDDQVWLVGGYDEFGNYLHDVWSVKPGSDWTRLTDAAPFSGRLGHQLVAFGDHLILSGGRTANQRGLTDVWRTTDGLDWQKAYLRTVNEAVVESNHL
ncbi:MAG: hypothetical protein P8X74_17905 [Reinekea sp.]